jgi:hypothetical protein
MSPQVSEQFDRLMRKGAFRPALRLVTGADAEDRLAKGIAQTFELARRKAERGERMDDALIVCAARLRATDIRRRFARGGQPRRDAVHPANYTDGPTKVLRLDGFEDESVGWPGECDAGLQAAWLAATSVGPGEKLAAAVDLDTWLAGLAAAGRELLAGRYVGLGLPELARAHGRSISWAFARLRALGRELAARAGVAVGGTGGGPHERAERHARC